MIRVVFQIIFLATCLKVAADQPERNPPQKIITITINADGIIFMDRDTLSTDDLAATLKERLWKSYLGNGKMYDSIKIKFAGEVLMGVRGSALDAIELARQNALKELCIQKYKKLFKNLSSIQKKKIKRQFPVLFQKLQW